MTGFFTYEVCPRGAGDAQDHVVKDLWHVWVGGRHACLDAEAVYHLQRSRVPYAGCAPR